jgi:hypothetical protein
MTARLIVKPHRKWKIFFSYSFSKLQFIFNTTGQRKTFATSAKLLFRQERLILFKIWLSVRYRRKYRSCFLSPKAVTFYFFMLSVGVRLEEIIPYVLYHATLDNKITNHNRILKWRRALPKMKPKILIQN